MMAHSPGMTLEAKSEGGVFAGLKRKVLAGESFFVTTYTAPPTGGWVDLASVLPGDMKVLDIYQGRPYYIARGNWLANSYGTEVSTKFGGRASLFGGEGAFGLEVSGQGQAIVSVYGAIDEFDIPTGHTVTIDTGHVVAYDLAIGFQMRKAAPGVVQSMKSGEGWVFDFTGPGKVLVQTRNPTAFSTWVASLTPQDNPQGGLGGIFK